MLWNSAAERIHVHSMLCVSALCHAADTKASVFFFLVSLFIAPRAAKQQQAERVAGKHEARGTLRAVNVKQIIKYGETTADRKRPLC